MMRVLVIFLTLLTQPPLRAVWDSPGVARVAWSGAGCLWIGQALYRCYEESGVLLLGATGPLDGAYRPAAFDVFRYVRADGSVEQAQLGGVVYLPVFRTSERAPMAERVWVAVWRG